MKIAIAVVSLAALTGAARTEDDRTVICKALLDSATRVARRGEMTELKQMAPALQKCQQHSEEKLARQAQEIVDRYRLSTPPARSN